MRRIRAVALTTAAAVAATGAAAWALHDRATGPVLGQTSCDQIDHGTAADAARAVSGLTAPTRAALTEAQQAGRHAGVALTVNSGYRSAAYQQRVYDCWVAQTGSAEAARRHALPPAESAHVAGTAVDVAPPSAAAWLEHSAGKYGLCRRYENEPWHFEYQGSYSAHGCPALLDHP
ncbi:D-alanyl-D-alanine carboxypeptidase family protein [Catenulispora subtropica]|uniref:D-alanyl-D-alanine carboxypeptidase-like core domain-containing protein n=1 Tax=Catenulispora subtropica TaxID=450798 RepID=A0ABP5DM88_9ACTN